MQPARNTVVLHRYGDASHFLAIAERVAAYLTCDPVFLIGRAIKRKISLRAMTAVLYDILRDYFGHRRVQTYVYGFAPESAYFIPLCLVWRRRGRRVLFTSFSDPVETLNPAMQLQLRANLRFASRFFDAAAVVSLSAQRTLAPYLHTALVQHAIDVNAYNRGETREGLVFLGRIAPYKNVGQIIASANSTGFALDLVGPNEMDAHELDAVAGSVRYLGPKTKAWIKAHLGGYRALVLASDKREPFGIVLLEAMAAGVLVVASRTHGTETIFRDWPDYPLLFEAGEGPDGLTAALTRLRALSAEDEAHLRARLMEIVEDYRPEARAEHWQEVLK